MTTAMHLFEGEQERIEAINVKADQDICDISRMAMVGMMAGRSMCQIRCSLFAPSIMADS